MSTAELIGIAGALLSFLLTVVLGIVAWTFTTFRGDTIAQVKVLESQNREQALAIKTLEAKAEHSDKSDSRLVETLEKLDDKIDHFSRELGHFGGILDALSRRLTGGGTPIQRHDPRKE